MDTYRILSTYGPGMENTREGIEAILFELGELKAGIDSEKVVCLIEEMYAQVSDVKISKLAVCFGTLEILSEMVQTY